VVLFRGNRVGPKPGNQVVLNRRNQVGLFRGNFAAQALIGFDEALRFFVEYQDSRLRGINYEIPVRVRRGSWEALIPQNVGDWVAATGGLVVGKYLVTAATEVAKATFKDVTTKEVFVGAIRGIQWTLKIGKHLGDTAIRTFHNVKFRRGDNYPGLVNSRDQVLYVPPYIVDMYSAAPPKLLEKLADIVEEDRALAVGVIQGNEPKEEKLTSEFKSIFASEDSDEAPLFPELAHGQHIVLEGDLTRGNETANTLGLKYKGHTLVCTPAMGSIVRYKPALFGRVRVHGQVSRFDEMSRELKRPHLLVDSIDALESQEPRSLQLFDDDKDEDDE
jgi:hypothetical protein